MAGSQSIRGSVQKGPVMVQGTDIHSSPHLLEKHGDTHKSKMMRCLRWEDFMFKNGVEWCVWGGWVCRAEDLFCSFALRLSDGTWSISPNDFPLSNSFPSSPKACMVMPSFSHGYWTLNSGLHVCAVSTLTPWAISPAPGLGFNTFQDRKGQEDEK